MQQTPTEETPATTEPEPQPSLAFPEKAADAERAEGASSAAQDAGGASPQVSDGGAEPRADAAPKEGPDRRRLEEQLSALKRREAELRRALTVVDHPDLAEPLRLLEGRAYAIEQAEGKMSQARSKAEERRLATLQKKLVAAQDKRAKLDEQIAELEREISTLGEERLRAFEAKRDETIKDLVVAFAEHRARFEAAGVDALELLPELARWLPEVQALAQAEARG